MRPINPETSAIEFSETLSWLKESPPSTGKTHGEAINAMFKMMHVGEGGSCWLPDDDGGDYDGCTSITEMVTVAKSIAVWYRRDTRKDSAADSAASETDDPACLRPQPKAEHRQPAVAPAPVSMFLSVRLTMTVSTTAASLLTSIR